MKLSDIDLRLLRVFQAVAIAGGFAKAQDALGISQPAISAQIAKLENRLSVRLCNRGPQGFSLTSQGTAVLQEVTVVLDQIDAAAERLNAIAEPSTKKVRFGVVDSMVTDPQNPLLNVIRTLRAQKRDVTVSIGIFDYLACLEELRANRLDIAIVGIAGNERLPSEAETLSLYKETSSLYCSPDHPCASITDPKKMKTALEQAEISAHSFVFNPIDQDLDPLLLDQSKGVAQDTIELTAYLSLAGAYVGLLPDHYAATWVRTGELVSLARYTGSITSDFHAIRLQSHQTDATFDFVWKILQRSI